MFHLNSSQKAIRQLSSKLHASNKDWFTFESTYEDLVGRLLRADLLFFNL